MGAKLTGMKELRRALEDLDKKTANKFTRIALASGANVRALIADRAGLKVTTRGLATCAGGLENGG